MLAVLATILMSVLDQFDPSPGQEVVFPFRVVSQDSSAQKPIVELNKTRISTLKGKKP